MDSRDEVMIELRQLRGGAGMSPGRLEASGAVMSALATSDPQVAFGRLVSALRGLGDGERVRALMVDLGLDLAKLLDRQPSEREVTRLGERRSGYGHIVGKDPKTLARWSDQTIADLRAQLISDQFDGDLYVVAGVQGDRITTISVIQSRSNGHTSERSSIDTNNGLDQPSLPCLIYGYPRDWRPKTLTLAASFLTTPYPKRVAAVVADSFFNLVFGDKTYDLELDRETVTCRFEFPRTDRLYAIWWSS